MRHNMKHREMQAARVKMSEGVFPVHPVMAECINAKAGLSDPIPPSPSPPPSVTPSSNPCFHLHRLTPPPALLLLRQPSLSADRGYMDTQKKAPA
ncbi:hypothetical protein PAMA_003865 [Pampus argenteus]